MSIHNFFMNEEMIEYTAHHPRMSLGDRCLIDQILWIYD
jgi:hypothetical protein